MKQLEGARRLILRVATSPKRHTAPERRDDAAQIRQPRAESVPAAIAKRLGIARGSVYRALG